jgi:hypothetical protein
MQRRRFLQLAVVALMGPLIAGLFLQAPAQEGGDAALSRGMITPATQEAIDTGLAFLARQQLEDGSWGTNTYQGNVAVTSLCALSFMAGGYQPGRGQYGQNVTRALEFIIAQENPGIPGFLNNPRDSMHGPMYGHGFGTLFLAEAHGMVNQPALKRKLKETLARAVKLIISAQNGKGGWRYQPRPEDADLSVTICQIMALRAARNAGITVPKTVADKCIEYVKACQDLRVSGGFRYQQDGGPPGFARTAAGVVALYSAGVYTGDEVSKGLDYLMQYKPGAVRAGGGGFLGEAEMHYFYGHYYAAQAMWIAGGRFWREWYPAIRTELLSRRNADGSWFDGRFCRHYCTAMALIILQMPNNYLPIMQR